MGCDVALGFQYGSLGRDHSTSWKTAAQRFLSAESHAMSSRISAFPIDAWLSDMREAIDRIVELGRSVLETHRLASPDAARNAERWHLGERLSDEQQALHDWLDCVRRIVESIEQCRQAINAEAATDSDLHQTILVCADTIEENLPSIERALVAIRHAALDLLQWTARSGKIEGSELPGEYRASYARLIAYAPIFNPMMAAFREDLLQLNDQPRLHPESQRLVSLVSRYNAVVDSARGFVRSVVEPPLELVFHETQHFLDDLKPLPPDQVATLATEVNDCCQLLLYDSAEFRRRVEYIGPQLAAGLDASMAVLTVSQGFKVVFTVDEDPVFQQLAITLLRNLSEHQLTTATDDLTRALYKHFPSN